MQYSQEQLQSILNNMYGSNTDIPPNQDDNGCPWANQPCCPSCGAPANCPTTTTAASTTTAAATTGTTTTQTSGTGISTSAPFYQGFQGGAFPAVPATPATLTAAVADIPPNQDDNGCPWANQPCCPSCGVAANCPTTGTTTNGTGTTTTTGTGTTAGWPYSTNGRIQLNQNPLFTNALTPQYFPTDVAPNQDENGCPLRNGCSVYSNCY